MQSLKQPIPIKPQIEVPHHNGWAVNHAVVYESVVYDLMKSGIEESQSWFPVEQIVLRGSLIWSHISSTFFTSKYFLLYSIHSGRLPLSTLSHAYFLSPYGPLLPARSKFSLLCNFSLCRSSFFYRQGVAFSHTLICASLATQLMSIIKLQAL